MGFWDDAWDVTKDAVIGAAVGMVSPLGPATGTALGAETGGGIGVAKAVKAGAPRPPAPVAPAAPPTPDNAPAEIHQAQKEEDEHTGRGMAANMLSGGDYGGGGLLSSGNVSRSLLSGY